MSGEVFGKRCRLCKQPIPPAFELMKLVSRVSGKAVYAVEGCPDRGDVQLAHEFADELQLAPSGFVGVNTSVSRDGFFNRRGQGYLGKVAGSELGDTFAQILQISGLAFTLRFRNPFVGGLAGRTLHRTEAYPRHAPMEKS